MGEISPTFKNPQHGKSRVCVWENFCRNRPGNRRIFGTEILGSSANDNIRLHRRGGAVTNTSIKRGDIYYITATEATGSEQAGDRPAIVVSNDIGNRYASVVEVVYLTTKRKTSIPTHVFINSAKRPSIALCEQIVTVCKSRLRTYIGSITVAEMRRIDFALSTSLGINQNTGGSNMKLSMNTPYGEMNFDMPLDKISDLIQRAMQYAAEQTEHKTQEAPLSPSQKATEQPKAPRTENKPHRRVDSLFGDFRGSQAVRPGKEEAEPEEYRGFLLLKCERCEKIKGFCAKTAIKEYTCECGGKTKLHDLKVAHLHCKCGSRFKYKTNLTGDTIEYNCLHCGSPVDMTLNSRKNTYVTISD